MAAEVTITPTEPRRGNAITVEATGFAASGDITLVIKTNDGSVVTVDGETDGSGDKTWTDVLSQEYPGEVRCIVTDEDDTSVTETVRVFS